MVSSLERQVQKDFSQRWEIYRVATHELGGIHLVAEMEYKYSTRQLMDMLEVLDVHDALKDNAYKKMQAEQKKT